MILWFAGVSFVFVWWVFRTPALDYRLVMLGSVLPVGEVVFGGPRLLHTLLAPVALLTIIMLATQKRRLVRRRWIGVAIGMLMHLVLDGIWARKEVFWFPFFGFASGDAWNGLPEFGHSIAVSLLLELIGLADIEEDGVGFGSATGVTFGGVDLSDLCPGLRQEVSERGHGLPSSMGGSPPLRCGADGRERNPTYLVRFSPPHPQGRGVVAADRRQNPARPPRRDHPSPSAARSR